MSALKTSLRLSALAATGVLAACGAQPGARVSELNLLPLPQKVAPAGGLFNVGAETIIRADSELARSAADRFAELVDRTYRVKLTASGDPGRGIVFRTVPDLAKEAYRLDVTPAGAIVTASDAAGLFYGGVTLWQLLEKQRQGLVAPAVTVEDAPRFAWRGLMLDSARHFQSPEHVKSLIDWMAAHKLNTLHWHLTDDQGWRIEIKKYPRLTDIGAWRVPAGEAARRNINPATGEPKKIGGFYTQEQIRDIVAYAQARAVTVVPEIDVPGHALAVIRAYPKYGTGVTPPPGIESHWGVFPYLFNVEEPTFRFLEDVLDEVLDLFPSTYVHVGGDEAIKDQLKSSPAVQARMRALGIEDEEKLQSWFIGRIGRFLEARGRKLVGWDEILEGGLPKGAMVMSWRGIEGAIEAAKLGHDTVLSPSPDLYFDHIQAETQLEPPGRGGIISLKSVYAFDPAPDSLSADEQQHILGLQGNLWTEHVRTGARAAYMMWPRGSAIAELGWSAPASRDFESFVDRLLPQLDRLKGLGLEAAPSAFRVSAAEHLDPAADTVTITLANEIGSSIHYTTDGTAPVATSPRAEKPITLPLPTRLRAVAFHDGRALPGALDRLYDEASVRRRADTDLKQCNGKLVLNLEDDAPVEGQRAAFLIDILSPCWIYERAPLDGVTAIEMDVGQMPFNFQLGNRDETQIRFRAPATPAGEVEVRLGCEGERIAVLPLGPATTNLGVTRLRAPIQPRSGTADLCITYTAAGPDPLWGIDSVQLVQGK